jgi:phosphoribosylformylglycinamidine cyclo-ligase
MGHRLEVYANPAHADEIIRISQSFGIPAQIVGRVEASATKKLTISSEYGEFIYE